MGSSKLYKIYEDLNHHKRSRSDAFEKAVKERLDKSFESYIHSLNASESFFHDKDEIHILKSVGR